MKLHILVLLSLLSLAMAAGTPSQGDAVGHSDSKAQESWSSGDEDAYDSDDDDVDSLERSLRELGVDL